MSIANTVHKVGMSSYVAFFPTLIVFQQETDYIMSYFDNGEEFGGDSDDNMDEAIYWYFEKEQQQSIEHA